MQSPPVPLKRKYHSQSLILKHVGPTFFPQCMLYYIRNKVVFFTQHTCIDHSLNELHILAIGLFWASYLLSHSNCPPGWITQGKNITSKVKCISELNNTTVLCTDNSNNLYRLLGIYSGQATGLTGRQVGVRFPAAHTASYPTGTGDHSSVGTATEAKTWPLTSIQFPRKENLKIFLYFPIRLYGVVLY